MGPLRCLAARIEVYRSAGYNAAAPGWPGDSASVEQTRKKPSQFRSIFANDLPASQAAELAATQRPIAATALTDVSGPPAWTSIPSWAVIGTADHAIPPAAQEFMAARAHATVTKINASHLSLISQPGEITNVIEQAAHHTS